jgi:hypothetical protein
LLKMALELRTEKRSLLGCDGCTRYVTYCYQTVIKGSACRTELKWYHGIIALVFKRRRELFLYKEEIE